MPSVVPRRHSVGSSGLSGLRFELLFEPGSADEAPGGLAGGCSSVGAAGLSRPPLGPRGGALKSPALRRRAEAVMPEAAAAYAAQLAAPRGELERALAAAATTALQAAAAAQPPPGEAPPSPGCEAVAAARLAAALRAAGFDAHAVGDLPSATAATANSASPAAGVHRANPMHRAARHPAWVVVDPAASGRPDSALAELLVVEPRLREQFEMPRPSPLLAAVLEALPPVFVGSERQLAQLVTWLADRLRDAFDAAGMALPPWRGAAALLARWQLDKGLVEADAGDEESLPQEALPPPRWRGGHVTEELVLRQRNGVPFTAHVSTCSPHVTPPRA